MDVSAGPPAAEPWPLSGLEHTADVRPHDVALTDNQASWTYAELAGAVGAAMASLRAAGVGPGSPVLLVAPNRAEAVAVYLAVIRLGATAVLVDRRAGAADARSAAEASGARIVVADPEAAVALGIDRLHVIALEDAVTEPRPIVGAWPAGSGSPAAIFFTSGTTSRPKGVRHSLSSLSAGARNLARTLSYTRADAPFLCSPLATSTGVSQVHLALDTGSRFILEDAYSAGRSLERLVTLEATVLGGAPVILEELLAAAEGRYASLPLRAVALGGAPIPRPLLERAGSRYGITASRVYGSSESPSAFGSDPSDTVEQRLSDEGVAMPGTQARIDPSNGELQLRGANLFMGYLDAEHNAEAFTADGWFRTGDQATLTDGRLRITGRLKEVVARKGLKVSMAEVDESVRGMPGCLEAATYGVPDPQTGERLVLALRAESADELTLQSVCDWLRERGLAIWKLPEQLVIWDRPLPRTATGKVRRTDLAQGASGRPTLLADRLHQPSDT